MQSLNQLKQETTTSLLKLYKTNKKATTQPLFRAKLAQRKQQYPELEVFKIQLEEEENNAHPDFYTEAKQKLFRYRLVFLSFSLFFLFLNAIIFSFSSNWSYTFLLDSSIKTKWFVESVTFFLSVMAFSCAYFPSTLHEATRNVVNKAKKNIQHIYEKQRIHNNIDRLLLWGTDYRKSCSLRHMYKELLHKIHECGEETYRLLKKISKNSQLPPKAKDRLYNQALADLHDRLFFTAQNFRQLTVN